MAHRSEFPPICVALGCADGPELEKLARAACDAGEEFLEVRMDMLDEPARGPAIVKRLRDRHPDVTLLATCRRKANGGQFSGSVEQELELLEAAIDAGARAVDVEVETASVARERVHALQKRAALIVSYHNFRSTPALDAVWRKMAKAPADVYKLVTMARKPSDNQRILEFARRHFAQHHREQPLVALAMGEAGVPSRILSLSRHCAFTYAAPISADGTAPGQISSSAMRRQYRAERCTCQTQVYGVIANPIGHSISPMVHNRAFHARRVDAIYLPFLVEESQLSDFFMVVDKLPLAGFSVTIPHKQRVLRHLDGVDELAQRIGAVNTVYRRKGKLRGTNTDAAGVTVPLEKRLKLKGATALIAGTGGGARAAAFALADKGARVSITGRNPGRARALARLSGAEAVDRDKLGGRRFDVLVHATSVGMHPRMNESFFEAEIPAQVVLDMVYNPLETLLLRRAKSAGKTVISGLEMFLEQAAAQFEIWTGASAPRLAMEQVAREALAA